MHGIMSSVIDLHEHQIEVARRVIEDPKQRYLLADEVGLGKTIEAGLIIRQYLLDHPDGHIVVIAPPLLRRQWVSELRQKFLLDDFGEATVSVLSHDDPKAWRGGTRDVHGQYRLHRNAGLLVIDEAHHLAALAEADPISRATYATLAELAAHVPRLLLLSATPLLHHEQTFLAMLNLLDPEVYRLSDVDGFRRRVRDRQMLGTAFFTFRHDVPPFLLREKISALRGMFPDDTQLGELLDAVLAAQDNPSALPGAVTSARIHISDTYRLHRRLLRTRRSDALLRTFPVRGRGRPSAMPRLGPDSASQEWLDDWREYVRSTIPESQDTGAHVRTALLAFADRAASHPPLVAAAARYRLAVDGNDSRAAELSAAERQALRSWTVDAVERNILLRAMTLEADSGSRLALVDFLRRNHRKTVIFASYSATAHYVHSLLLAEFGSGAIAAHLADADAAVAEGEFDRFRDGTGDCWILVCDRSAEEGRNLQFVDQAIHFDLPLSPNRLEQRIGRLDRYAHGEPVPQFLIESRPDTIARTWEICLANGFQVFDRSIASLQFAVDALMPEVLQGILDDGVIGLAHITEELPGRLASERAAVAEQDALDAIEVADLAPSVATALDELEDMWFHIQRATEGLLCDELGNLRFHRVVDPEDEYCRSYRFTAPHQAPDLNSMPLVAWDALLKHFRPVVEQTGTYFRRAATARADVRLFRLGEPLIDALVDYVRWDDRGQTFAFWRASDHIADESIHFCFDYVIEADTNEAARVLSATGEELDRRALQRRADGFLPPTLETLWTTLDGSELHDGPLCHLLERPYDPACGDLNLNQDRRWALDQLIGEGDWGPRCRTARAESEQSLRARASFVSACESASARFEAASRVTHTQRRVRLGSLTERQRAVEEAELEAEVNIDAALAEGIRMPRVRLDAVGVVVLGPRMPQGPGFPGPRA
jgi:ATP-dependent helicase HepA